MGGVGGFAGMRRLGVPFDLCLVLDRKVPFSTLRPADLPSLYPSGNAQIGRVFVFLWGCRMKYQKAALSFDAQADLLLSRGLEADRDEPVARLSRTNNQTRATTNPIGILQRKCLLALPA